jgi:hypothetical protein
MGLTNEHGVCSSMAGSRPSGARLKTIAARYTLTPAGRKQLAAERQEFARIVLGVDKVLTTA